MVWLEKRNVTIYSLVHDASAPLMAQRGGMVSPFSYTAMVASGRMGWTSGDYFFVSHAPILAASPH